MTLILKDDNGNELPAKIQKKVNKFIDKLPTIRWFKPKEDLSKEKVDAQVNFTLKCFWVEASLEYKKLSTKEDWASAWDSAWDYAWTSACDYAWTSAMASAMDSAWASAIDSACDSAMASAMASARDSAMDSAIDSAMDSAIDSAWDSAWASAEILVKHNKDFKEKYPNWAFKQLFKLRKMGLYPVWVVDWKFIVYVPEVDWKMPREFETL